MLSIIGLMSKKMGGFGPNQKKKTPPKKKKKKKKKLLRFHQFLNFL
jgi:hypothetical protein